MTTKAVETAVDLLYRMSADHREWGVRELGRQLALTKSTVQRLLTTLENKGLVTLTSAQKYRLGPGVVRLAAPYLQQSDLITRCQPHLQRLRDLTGETICLHVRVMHNRVSLYQIESPHELRWSVEIGRVYPLHAGASGKVLLAFLPQAVIEDIVNATGLPALSPRTTTDPDTLLAELAAIARDGYSVTRGERMPGGVGMAAPLFGPGGQLLGSVSIYGPEMRMGEEEVARYLPLLLEACSAISHEA